VVLRRHFETFYKPGIFMPRQMFHVVAGSVVTLALLGCAAASETSAANSGGSADLKLLQRFVDEFVRIEPGNDPFPKEFQIGSDEEGDTALPAARVVMPIHFRISKYEMTQDLYESVMGSNPSRWKGRRNSAESMTFDQAKQCCVRLTVELHAAKLIAPDEEVRLPTEAEWEYCCRAGTTTRYSFGDMATAEGDTDPQARILDDYAWHTGNAAGNDPEVGVLKPNPWQLYDMHGYLWEFVSVPYPPAAAAQLDPPPAAATTPDQEPRCIIRGGSWQDHHALLTSASRRKVRVSRTSDGIGFRCVIVQRPQAEAAGPDPDKSDALE
jgi:formylglycine-generating enzyme required for sulfatase activity